MNKQKEQYAIQTINSVNNWLPRMKSSEFNKKINKLQQGKTFRLIMTDVRLSGKLNFTDNLNQTRTLPVK